MLVFTWLIEVAHRQSVFLGGTEDQRLLFLVDQVHEYLHSVHFALPDDDGLVELALGVALAGTTSPTGRAPAGSPAPSTIRQGPSHASKGLEGPGADF